MTETDGVEPHAPSEGPHEGEGERVSIPLLNSFDADSALVTDLCVRHTAQIRTYVQSLPMSIRSFWGGGFRAEKATANSLARGLRPASLKHRWIYEECLLLWKLEHEPLSASIRSAAIRGNFVDHRRLNDAAVNWLALRYQPALADLAAAMHFLRVKEPLLCPWSTWDSVSLRLRDTVLADGGQRILAAPVSSPLAPQLRRAARELAMELLRVPSDPDTVAAIRSGDSASLVNIETADTEVDRATMNRALRRFLAGELDGAVAELSSFPDDGDIGSAWGFAIEMLVHFARGEMEDCAGVFSRFITSKMPREFYTWPTWYTLGGIALLETGSWAQAAHTFLMRGGGSCELAIAPVQLCAEALAAGGVESGPLMCAAIARGWATSKQRQGCAVELEELLALRRAVSVPPRYEAPGDDRNGGTTGESEALGEDIEDGAEQSVVEIEDDASDEIDEAAALDKRGPLRKTSAVLIEPPAASTSMPPSEPDPADLLTGSAAEELRRLREAFHQLAGVKERRMAAVAREDADEESALQTEQTRLKEEVDVAERAVRGQLGPLAAGLPPLPVPIEERLRWLQAAARCFIQREGETRERLERRRDALAEDCRGLGVTVPPTLLAATTLKELGAAEEALAPVLRIERAYLHLRESGDTGAPPELRVFGAADRAALYQRLASEGGVAWPPERLLRVWIADQASWPNPEVVRRAIAPLFRALVEASANLPAGAWPFWARLWGEGAGRALAELDAYALADVLETDPASCESLRAALVGATDLPAPMERIFALRDAERTAPGERLKALVAVSRRYRSWAPARRSLVEATLNAGLWGEALMLARVGVHQGWLVEVDRRYRDAFFWCLLRHPGRLSDEVMAEFQNASDLLDDEFDLLLLLAGAARHGLYEEIPYWTRSLLEPTQRRWPASTGLLRAAIEAPERIAPERQIAAQARQAQAEFEKGQQKPQLYTNWSPSRDYLRHFTETLARFHTAVERGQPAPDEDPEAIINETATEYGLKVAEGKARQAMRLHLIGQIQCLAKLAEAVRTFSSWSALEDAIAREESLSDELARLTVLAHKRPILSALREQLEKVRGESTVEERA
jgi:hypothetical protein